MAYRQLTAKLSSVAELAKENLEDVVAKIASKKVDIKRKEKAREKVRKNLIKLDGVLRSLQEKAKERLRLLINTSARDRDDCLFALKVRLEELHAKRAAVSNARTEMRNLSFALHQHKRRLTVLEHQAERATLRERTDALLRIEKAIPGAVRPGNERIRRPCGLAWREAEPP
jgi:chromosome segregation ATPase